MITIRIWTGTQNRYIDRPAYTLEIKNAGELMSGLGELANLAALKDIANSLDPATTTDKLMDWVND